MFVWPVRVYYEDTDSGGVVYYANYLKFMERARSEWLRGLGVEQDELLARERIIFAVRSVQVDYLQSARFNDILWVTAEIAEQGRASLSFSQRVLRPGSAARAEMPPQMAVTDFAELIGDKSKLLCTGQVRIACLDAATMRPRSIPSHLFAEISRGG
ncbi:MAG: tol-pal system-associated acyl-CoA thioesterase [Gammaproteobacteria bacterium]